MEIDGREIVFRDTLPARMWWNLFPKITGVKAGDILIEKFDWNTAISLVCSTVESWEFDGDPNDPETYVDWNFIDVVALVNASYEHVIKLYAERMPDPGEVENGST